MKKQKENKEKRDDYNAIIKKLETGIINVFDIERYKQFLEFMSKFHNYSYNNCVLILSQYPSAERVGSYALWKKLGYTVKKGEKGIKILVPIKYKIKQEDEIEEEEEYGLTFKIGYVFDIAQTNAELPTLCEELKEDSVKLKRAVKDIFNNTDISYYENEKSRAKGYCNLTDGSIHVKRNMSASQTLKTIIHEKAHSLLHCNDNEFSRNDMEVQAESIAFCVCNRLKIDTSEYSFPYIASWSCSKKLDELKQSLNVIEKTTKEILNWVCNVTSLTIAD